jgi:hypothetical protein
MYPDLLIAELNHRVEELSGSRRKARVARLLRK